MILSFNDSVVIRNAHAISHQNNFGGHVALSTESDRLFSLMVLPSMILSQSGMTKSFYDSIIRRY